MQILCTITDCPACGHTLAIQHRWQPLPAIPVPLELHREFDRLGDTFVDKLDKIGQRSARRAKRRKPSKRKA